MTIEELDKVNEIDRYILSDRQSFSCVGKGKFPTFCDAFAKLAKEYVNTIEDDDDVWNFSFENLSEDSSSDEHRLAEMLSCYARVADLMSAKIMERYGNTTLEITNAESEGVDFNIIFAGKPEEQFKFVANIRLKDNEKLLDMALDDSIQEEKALELTSTQFLFSSTVMKNGNTTSSIRNKNLYTNIVEIINGVVNGLSSYRYSNWY